MAIDNFVPKHHAVFSGKFMTKALRFRRRLRGDMASGDPGYDLISGRAREHVSATRFGKIACPGPTSVGQYLRMSLINSDIDIQKHDAAELTHKQHIAWISDLSRQVDRFRSIGDPWPDSSVIDDLVNS